MTAHELHAAVETGDIKTVREILTGHPDIVDLGRGEMRALHMAVLGRDLEMSKLLLECGADTQGGIWPNRDATSSYVIARDRDYDEILEVIRAAEKKRGARGPDGPTEATHKLHQAYMTGSEEAMVAVYDQHPELAEMCPPDGVTLLHQMAGHGATKLM